MDIGALLRILWRNKLIVVAGAVVFGLLAVYLALKATPIFRGEATITEVQESELGGASSLAGQFGGLASLAGLNIGGSGQSRQWQAVLGSRRLVEEFVKRNDVLALMSPGPGTAQSLWLGVQQFRKDALIITEDKLKGVTTVSIDWTDPVTAARWANGFVALANELIRARAISDATRNIEYLNKQIATTNVLEVQRVMYNLIESQTKTLMLANGRAEYAFMMVDPAVPPEKRISPKRTLMVLSGLVIGGLIGTAVALFYDASRRRRRSSADGHAPYAGMQPSQ